MNLTAKKLREAADYMGLKDATSLDAMRRLHDTFDIAWPFTVAGDIGAVFSVIADELDALQARASEANYLRQQLESAEDKAEHRKQHIEHLNTAIRDKNALLEQRGGTIARLTAENGKLRKQVPTERERQILDMWPRFEDGQPVWFGDSVEHDGTMETVQRFKLYRCGPAYLSVVGIDTEKWLRIEDYKSVKRPAPKVLDADGVEIHVGDTVWHHSGLTHGVVTSIDAGSLMNTTRYVDGSGNEFRDAARSLTHTRPDSWERLEKDASKDTCVYFGGTEHFDCSECSSGGINCFRRMKLDIVRRAKVLAGVGVD